MRSIKGIIIGFLLILLGFGLRLFHIGHLNPLLRNHKGFRLLRIIHIDHHQPDQNRHKHGKELQAKIISQMLFHPFPFPFHNLNF